MKVFLTKTLTGFQPMNEAEQEKLKRIKLGTSVSCEIKRPRNMAFHKLFFAMLNLAFENQDKYESAELFLTVVKLGVHHCDTVVMPTGFVTYTPKSINFSKMDQDEFHQFYEKAARYVTSEILPPGTSWETLAEESRSL